MVKSEDGVDVSPHLGAKFVTNGEAPKSPLELVPPNIPGGKLALGKQHHRLVHCITLAIDHTYLSLFCENAFPLLPEKRRQYRRALSTAAAETDSSDIAMELGSNADYAQWLASVVRSFLTRMFCHLIYSHSPMLVQTISRTIARRPQKSVSLIYTD